ncbi:MAG: FAD-binding oxidoreductase [Burkholderiaceae bacterium]|nr:FAD-binding oxidoreductase [Burkholderiaceae bacterium]
MNQTSESDPAADIGVQADARHVAVIGAGIVGACCALALLDDGHRVTLVEPDEPGGEQAASYGNGAWFSSSSVVPMSVPGLWRKVPGYLVDRDGPLTIRPGALPSLAPWLLRFLRAGARVERVEATARALAALLHDAPARHAALAAQAGVPELVRASGQIHAFADRAAFEAEALAWRLRRDNGAQWVELDAAQLRARVPMLDSRYGFGIYIAGTAHCPDPGAYVAALVALAERRGAKRMRARALGFERRAGRLAAVRTDAGRLDCDAAVIAAGIRSAVLARAAGDTIPLASERGYHVEIADPPFTLDVPVMPADGRMANTSTRGGLRIAGQVELARTDAAPDWRRAEVLLRHAQRAYPALASIDTSRLRRWMGHRPSTPDGLPVIDASIGTRGVFHAFGHGHVGLAAAPASAELLARIVAESPGPMASALYSMRRFVAVTA